MAGRGGVRNTAAGPKKRPGNTEAFTGLFVTGCRRQATVAGAFLRPRRATNAAAARPNRITIGGAGTSVGGVGLCGVPPPDEPDEALLVAELVALLVDPLLPKLLEPPVAPLEVLVLPVWPEEVDVLPPGWPDEPPEELLLADDADDEAELLDEDDVDVFLLSISMSMLVPPVDVDPPLVDVDPPDVEVDPPDVDVEEPPLPPEDVEVDDPPDVEDTPPVDVDVDAVKIALPPLPPKKPPAKNPPPPLKPPLPPMTTAGTALPPPKPLLTGKSATGCIG